jgi:hypothetical protein
VGNIDWYAIAEELITTTNFKAESKNWDAQFQGH